MHRRSALVKLLLYVGAAASIAVASFADAVGGLEDASTDRDWAPALAAMERKDWPAAVALLTSVASRDDRNAEVHNRLGFALRQRGDVDAALVHYRRALAIAPGHLGAHEYIGEAYLKLGDVARAREHLAALERLCGRDCDEYRDLAKAIAAVGR